MNPNKNPDVHGFSYQIPTDFATKKAVVFSLQVQNNPPKKPGLLYFSPPPFLGDVFNLCLKKPPCWLNIHLTVADVRRKNKKKSQIFRSFPPIP